MRSKLKVYFFVVLAVFGVVAGCSKAPSGVLAERKMKEVLVDMHLAEAMIGSESKVYNTPEKKQALYLSVFEKHGITEAEYDSSLVWYGRNLDVYMQVYEMVLSELNLNKKALGDIQPDATPSSNQDSVNIWNRFAYLSFLPKAPYNGVYFDFVPEGGYPAGSSFVLSFRLWGLNKYMTEAPEVRISVEQPDTTITAMRYITYDGLNELLVKANPVAKVKRVYGYIRLKKSDDEFYKVYINDIRLMKYNYGTEVQLVKDSVPAVIFPADTLWADPVRMRLDSIKRLERAKKAEKKTRRGNKPAKPAQLRTAAVAAPAGTSKK